MIMNPQTKNLCKHCVYNFTHGRIVNKTHNTQNVNSWCVKKRISLNNVHAITCNFFNPYIKGYEPKAVEVLK